MKADDTLPTGYFALPPGKIATAVTCLEMLSRPEVAGVADTTIAFQLSRWHQPDPGGYRDIFRAIGADWLWFSRLARSDLELRSILHDARVEVYVLRDGECDIGLAELDFRVEGECELAYFGLVTSAIGTGAGRWLMDRAIALAWQRPIGRFWVHTCHFDHPRALGFYQRSGFRPYAMMVEVLDDPRLSGVLPRSAAPHVPLIEISHPT